MRLRNKWIDPRLAVAALFGDTESANIIDARIRSGVRSASLKAAFAFRVSPSLIQKRVRRRLGLPGTLTSDLKFWQIPDLGRAFLRAAAASPLEANATLQGLLREYARASAFSLKRAIDRRRAIRRAMAVTT